MMLTRPTATYERPPRLAVVTTVPDSFRAVVGHLQHAKNAGFEIHLISSAGPFFQELADSLSVAQSVIPFTRRIDPLRDAQSAIQLSRILASQPPDIVHAHTPKAGLIAMLVARWHGIPARIYHMRGLRYSASSGLKRHLLRAIERSTVSLSSRTICVSRSLRELALRDRIAREDQITVLGHGGHGIDCQHQFNPRRYSRQDRFELRRRYGIPHDAIVLGFVGRLVRDKGIDELAAAWRGLRKECSQLHLLLVGKRESNHGMGNHVWSTFDGDPRVHEIGENWETPPLYNAMDVVSLPSYREGLPKVPLEAAAMSLPVVATRIAGCVDAVNHGQTGVLVPPRDASALADAIKSYVVDPARRKRHGQAGRLMVQDRFSPDRLQNAMLSEYQQLLDVTLSRRENRQAA